MHGDRRTGPTHSLAAAGYPLLTWSSWRCPLIYDKPNSTLSCATGGIKGLRLDDPIGDMRRRYLVKGLAVPDEEGPPLVRADQCLAFRATIKRRSALA